jgi:hypothetical protein
MVHALNSDALLCGLAVSLNGQHRLKAAQKKALALRRGLEGIR